jgi:sulfur relay (sulfurtransferase) complex TusBCD TusD component (DsrE family)
VRRAPARIRAARTPLVELLKKGVDVSCCGTCCSTRGLTEDRLVAHARVATIHDLAEATVRNGRVVSF